MVRRRISEAQRWQIIGMHTTDVLQSYWTSDGLPLYCSQPTGEKTHTNQQCERLAKIRQTTGNIWSDRDDRVLQRLVRRMPFATSPVLKQHWLPNRRLSTRTVRNRLKSAWLKSRRIIKRPLLADRHRRSRLAWGLAWHGWNLRTWRKIHWSDESRFLLHVTDGRMRIWTKIQPIPQGTSSQLSFTVEAQ
jgi:hypothetical protein